MDFLVLGPVEVRKDGERVPIGGPKQRGILALLIADAGHPVSLQRIISGVYGDEAAPGAAHSVQTFISMFRRQLGDVVRKDPGGYSLTVEPGTIDAVRFGTKVDNAVAVAREQPQAAAAALRDALAMWRGHAYADVDGRGDLEPEITRLGELRLAALEARIDADLATGRHRELVGELEALTIDYPLRERFSGQLMLALYRGGRQTEALRAFERTRIYLSEEIGIDPSPDLRRLEQRILHHDPTLEEASVPSVTQRAVVVVEVADARALMRLTPDDRTSRVAATVSRISDAVERHGGLGPVQRGSALYATFTSVVEAVAAVKEAMLDSSAAGLAPRAAIDLGDLELHESGEVSGPPVRRSAGLVAVGHPGQVLLSAEAHHALTAVGAPGWVARSLGVHPILGMEAPQQVFQLVLPSENREFPPLLVDVDPLPLPVDRRAVAAYELRRPISADLSGTTYRAYHPMAGREVVVTVIDPVWANQPDFVRRFEVETQLVSRLNHPHIVPLLDSWRDPSGAFLVSAAVGKRTLADAMAAEDLDDATQARVIGELAAALSHAHRLGIVHGAVSPDEVVLDESDHGYLTAAGFVARLTGVPHVVTDHGHPETADGDPPTAAADVTGLGRLAGRLMAPTTMDRPESSGLIEVLTRVTSEHEDDRYPSMDDFLAAFRTALGHEAPVGFTPTRNPYKGLEAFGEADAGDFFGRREAVDELVSLIADRRLVAVVGPSGSGKSSLVRAGLVPAVRTGGLDGHDAWVVAEMIPGAYPLEELASALTQVSVETTDGLIDELHRDDGGLGRVLGRILPRGTRLLLVIDQFEELFTLTRGEGARSRLLGSLVALATDERSDTRIVLTLRADFFDRPLQHPEFGAVLREGVHALTTPTDDQLADAIRRPAQTVGVSFEAGLPERIVADLSGSPGTLPLLQYTLTQLFEGRRTDQITHQAYRESGGVMGALGSRADVVFTGLDTRLGSTARQVFLRLVTVQPSGETTRHRARMLELNALADPQDVAAVLAAFGDARLLTFDRDPVSRGPTVEVAHEALLSRWPRLTGWVESAHEDLLLHRRLAETVEEWDQRDRADGYLLGDSGLVRFESWAETTDLALTVDEVEYLRAGRERADRQQARRRRVRTAVTAGFAAAAVVAGMLALQAARNAEVAESRALAASAVNVLDEDPELSLLLSLEAARIGDPPFESVAALHESLGEHRKILTYEWPTEQAAADLSTGISPDGSLLVATAGTNYVEVVDIDSGERLWERAFPESAIVRAAFTPDGSGVVATVGWVRPVDGGEAGPELEAELGAHILESRTGTPTGHVATGDCGIVTGAEVIDVVVGPDGLHLVAEVEEGSACRFRGSPGDASDRPPIGFIDLGSGQVATITAAQGGAFVTPDGRRLIKPAVDKTLAVTEAALGFLGEATSTGVADGTTGRIDTTLSGFPLGISADGDLVVTALLEEDQIVVWDTSSETPLSRIDTWIATYPRGIYAWLSPDGGTVARSLEGAGLELFDARSGVMTDHIRTGLGSNERVSFSTDGSRLAVGELFGGTAVVIDGTPPSELGFRKLCPGFYGNWASVDERAGTASLLARCAVPPFTSTQYVVDTETLEVGFQSSAVAGLRSALSHDGRWVANQPAEPSESRFVVRKISTGDIVHKLEAFQAWPHDLDFSPDGSLLALAGEATDAVIVWDIDTGAIAASVHVPHLTAGPDRVLDVEFSPDGERLAATFVWTPKELWMISTDDWQPMTHYEAPETATNEESPAINLQFTPDGSTLVGTDFGGRGSGQITFMDGVTLEHLAAIPDAHRGGVADLALNEEGTLLASAGNDGVVRVWDMSTRELLHEIPVSREAPGVGGVAFAEDDRHLLVTSMADGALRKVTVDTAELLDIARTRVTRTFTDTECSVYRIDPCPTLEEVRAR